MAAWVDAGSESGVLIVVGGAPHCHAAARTRHRVACRFTGP
jgi:hypothetical protein